MFSPKFVRESENYKNFPGLMVEARQMPAEARNIGYGS
jgi:hypothetical protein